MPLSEDQIAKNKNAAKQCMLKADQLIKDSHFAEAKAEVQKAKALDPSNVYINAFIDRISYFEEQKKTDASKKAKEIIPEVHDSDKVSPKSEIKPKDVTPMPQPVKAAKAAEPPKAGDTPVVKKEGADAGQEHAIPHPPVKPQPAIPVQPKKEQPVHSVPPQPSTPPVSAQVPETKKTTHVPGVQPIAPKAQSSVPVPPPQVKTVTPKEGPVQGPAPIQTKMPSDTLPTAAEPQRQQIPKLQADISAEKSSAKIIPPVAAVPEVEKTSSNASPNIHDLTAEKQITAQQLAAMKKQIEKLSLALEQEKMAREEMHQQQVQKIIPQFRTILENAWIDGAPSDAKKAELMQLARTMTIPDALINSLQREVKIAMYGKAVKEVITKRRVIRHSSSTLDWLRKVYQITMEEYVEYESKFLLDLVADQYKGIILQISSDEETKNHITPRLKSAGYAVIVSLSPEDALEKIDKLNPNLIICESSFGPGTISGIRFLHILRTNSKYNFVPFILLSTPEDHALLTASDLKPNEGYLVKPVNDEDLSAMINSKLLWFKEYVMSLSQ
jgi:CheY-like chemotaxis protein